MHRPPSIGQTDLDPEEQGSRQPPSTHAWVRIMIMIEIMVIITLVKLQSASRSQGRTRFSEAEADSPVSWATELPRSRSSPDIILWLYSPDITLILWLYTNPLSGPSGATMATWQHGCLKQGSMVVTGDHKAAPGPWCSRDINARERPARARLRHTERHTICSWPRQGLKEPSKGPHPSCSIMQKSCQLQQDVRYDGLQLLGLVWGFLECPEQQLLHSHLSCSFFRLTTSCRH